METFLNTGREPFIDRFVHSRYVQDNVRSEYVRKGTDLLHLVCEKVGTNVFFIVVDMTNRDDEETDIRRFNMLRNIRDTTYNGYQTYITPIIKSKLASIFPDPNIRFIEL